MESHLSTFQWLLGNIIHHPRVLINSFNCYSFWWVSFEHSPHKILGLFGDLSPVSLVELYFRTLDLVFKLGFIFEFEGRVAAHKDVENDAQWPDIDCLFVLLAHEYLGGHVKRSSNCSGHEGLVSDDLRNSEVDYLESWHTVLSRIYSIFRFQVAVYDSALMQVPDRVYDGQ